MSYQPHQTNNQAKGGLQDSLNQDSYVTPSQGYSLHVQDSEGHVPNDLYQRTVSPSFFSELNNEYQDNPPRRANEPRSQPFTFLSVGTILEEGSSEQLNKPPFAAGDGVVLRGIQEYGEVPGVSHQFSERSSAISMEKLHILRIPTSSSLNTLPSGHSTYDMTDSNAKEIEHVRSSTFTPFQGQIKDSETAKQFRKAQTRGSRMPYLDPDTDESISAIEQNRLYHVERIYNAMTRGDKARDNDKSIAMKRWVHGAYYKPLLVEAHCHKILDCLLDQAKFGYRGWDHNDYVADDRKGEDEDRDVDCAARLNNILRALEQEKTICEDAMNSACQIRMFVNAPKAYANRKYQNRVGNSKRGRPKDAEEGTPSKRRTPLRPTTRARTTSDLRSSTAQAQVFGHTPIRTSQQPRVQQQSRVHPQAQYATPPTQSIASPITMPGGTPVSSIDENCMSTHSPYFGFNQMSPMSPLTSIQHQNTAPFVQRPIVLSPSHVTQGLRLTPMSPDMPSNLPVETWPPMQTYDNNFTSSYCSPQGPLVQHWVQGAGGVSAANVDPILFSQDPNTLFLGFSTAQDEPDEQLPFGELRTNQPRAHSPPTYPKALQ